MPELEVPEDAVVLSYSSIMGLLRIVQQLDRLGFIFIVHPGKKQVMTSELALAGLYGEGEGITW